VTANDLMLLHKTFSWECSTHQSIFYSSNG